MKKALILGSSKGIGKSIRDSLVGLKIEILTPSRKELDTSKLDSVKKYIKNLKNGIDYSNPMDQKVSEFKAHIEKSINISTLPYPETAIALGGVLTIKQNLPEGSIRLRELLDQQNNKIIKICDKN